MYRLALALGFLLPQGALADSFSVQAAAIQRFDRMPALQVVNVINENCGADSTVDARVAYCTTANRVLVARDGLDDPLTEYLVAHAFGHAVQVRHGVADVALAEIRARRSEEAALRGMVEAQVDCIAGFLLGQAGLTLPDLVQSLEDDPLSGRHWGRDPLHIGPLATVPVTERNAWIARGYAGDLGQCAVGEFGAELLLAALKS